jgi:hypothetical protein
MPALFEKWALFLQISSLFPFGFFLIFLPSSSPLFLSIFAASFFVWLFVCPREEEKPPWLFPPIFNAFA